MNKLALILAGVALVACTSSEDTSNTDANGAAATRGYGQNDPPPPPPEGPAPASDPGDGAEPQAGAPGTSGALPPESCASLRAKAPAAEAFSFASSVAGPGPLVDIDKWHDVEAELREETDADGTHRYTVVIALTTVRHYSQYAARSLFPMDAQAFELSGTVTSKTALANPWQGELEGGVVLETVRCRRGVATGTGSDPGGSAFIVLTRVDADWVEGSFEHRTPNGGAFMSGTFKAPRRIPRSLGLPFTVGSAGETTTPPRKGFAPGNETVCCKLEE